MCAEYIQETGLELLLLHFPTLRIRQLALFGCKSWGFVIYNQFSALVSSALACPFLQFVSCPEGPCSIPLLYQSSLSPLLLPLSASASSLPLSPSPSLHALQSVPQLCKQWELFTMVHHQGAPGAPPNTLAELSQPLHKCFTLDVERYRPSEQLKPARALKEPFT